MATLQPHTTGSQPVIFARDVETRFGEHVVHQGLDLEVRPGEILGLVGGSGTGKTVLMRQLMGLALPTSGTIELFGQRLTGGSDRAAQATRRRIGVLFQHGALFTGFTVRENVELVLREHTRLPSNFRRDLAGLKIHLAGLPTNAAEKHPSELSGGMTKRAALARALALDPELLFLDEPTSGLDPVSAAAFDRLIVELRDLLGLTVIMITHDPESLWQATDRVAFLANRRVQALAPVEELVASSDPDVCRYFQGVRSQRGGG